MKIVFLCTSIEAGRDGVGDYTCKLALELIRQGHQTAIVALNDKYCQVAAKEELVIENILIPTFRIPFNWQTRERFHCASLWINAFDPEWLSLQFVIFGFQLKGLPFGLHNLLYKIGKGRKWHIMFHELWVGSSVGASKKHIAWGWVQKKIIQSIIKSLQPVIVHTHSQLYLAQLNKLGYHITRLPLFSNIPVLYKEVTKESIKPSITFITFGTLHPGAPVELFAKEAAQYAYENRTQVNLTIIGRSGADQNRWVTSWNSVGLTVNSLGEQPSEQVSKLLGSATFGISTSALAMIEKSGTVAAMLAHGLPVLCVSQPWKSREVDNPTLPLGILEYRPGNLGACLVEKQIYCSVPGSSDIACQFINDLQKATVKPFNTVS